MTRIWFWWQERKLLKLIEAMRDMKFRLGSDPASSELHKLLYNTEWQAEHILQELRMRRAAQHATSLALKELRKRGI